MKKVESLPNHYSNIDNLTLYRWDRYVNTKDNNWFLVDYDGRQKKKSSDELDKLEESIQDQYFTAIDDRSFSLKIQKWAKIGYLRQKYDVVDALLNRMWSGFGDDLQQQEVRFLIIKELRSWGFKFPQLNSAVDDRELIINFRKSLEGIKTQIAIISNELVDDGKKESKNLYAQIVIAKSSLPNYEMNPRIMVLSEWIEICKIIQEIAKKN